MCDEIAFREGDWEAKVHEKWVWCLDRKLRVRLDDSRINWIFLLIINVFWWLTTKSKTEAKSMIFFQLLFPRLVWVRSRSVSDDILTSVTLRSNHFICLGDYSKKSQNVHECEWRAFLLPFVWIRAQLADISVVSVKYGIHKSSM